MSEPHHRDTVFPPVAPRCLDRQHQTRSTNNSDLVQTLSQDVHPKNCLSEVTGGDSVSRGWARPATREGKHDYRICDGIPCPYN